METTYASYQKKKPIKVYFMKSRLDVLSLVTKALIWDRNSNQQKPQGGKKKGFQYIQFMTVGRSNNHIKTATLKPIQL